MTYEKLFGIYFNETVNTTPQFEAKEFNPLFIIQTETAITKLDDVLTEYNNIETFKTDVENKGLTKTVKYIENTLLEAENSNFYIYSLKTNTADGINNSISITENKEDIRDIFYFEENTINGLNIKQKIAAFKTAAEAAETRGAFKYVYITPYATINGAIDEEENTAPEATAIATWQDILTATGSGRIIAINPDGCANMSGKAAAREFSEEIAATGFNTDVDLKYNFTAAQQLILQNLGVLFIRERNVQGVKAFRIHGGLTTSFKDGAADGLLKSRTICDELLRRVKWEIDPYIMETDNDNTVKFIQTAIDAKIDEFNGVYTVKSGTSLTASKAGNYTINLNGQITPYGSTLFINVNTTFY